MKKDSIVFKLFLGFTLMLCLFVGIFMLGQALFFERFYLDMKIANLEKNMGKFSLNYTEQKWQASEIIKSINQFAASNNSQIAILDDKGTVKYMPTYDLVMETVGKEKIKIPLNTIVYFNEFQNLDLALGSKIKIEGYFSDDLKYTGVIHSIEHKEVKWENINVGQTTIVRTATPAIRVTTDVSDTEEEVSVEGNLTMTSRFKMIAEPIKFAVAEGTLNSLSTVKIKLREIEGSITELNIPSRVEQVSSYNNDLLWGGIEFWTWQMKTGKMKMLPEGITTFDYEGAISGADNIAFVQPIIKDNKVLEYLFVISSLQPVGEAVDAITGYYIYAFLIGVVIISIMSLIFSRVISRPLITMNRIAAQMANLDFSKECEVKSKDEIGTLANSLNKLSKNLGVSLKELKAANEQLHLDIEKERNLEKMRKEFVSSVSHEFKTPLGIIKGFTEGIRDQVAEDKKEYYIEVIMDEIDKMDHLILDLMDLAKLESKTQELNNETFNIIELIDEVKNRLLQTIDEKNITMVFKYRERITEAYGDRRKIEQVIINILTNAVRHAEFDKYIEIGVEEENSELMVYIENSGEPISEEDISKIWERFYRAEKSRRRKTGGTGLGLAIVKTILERHESHYGVKNTDRGVRFYFTLKKNQANV
jgi:signal transduction histidine kinase